MLRPELLRADNWTPRTRTPCGGTNILGRYKTALFPGSTEVVGESWEISVEPSFPSVLARSGEQLGACIARDPKRWLGEGPVVRHGAQLSLLVKLLDAAEHLSVQVHPEANDPTLAPDESGKPEGWIILDAKPGSGLYLGFQEGVGRAEVEACLRNGGRLDTLMNFVPVASGDAFVINAGTPHAIGAGVTLVEPQHVVPGRKGVTYRFWDWNRRYDTQGRPAKEGTARELHVERSLAVTRWDIPGGEAFVEHCRAGREVLDSGDLSRTRVMVADEFEAERWRGSGTLTAPTGGAFSGLTCVRGTAMVRTVLGEVALECGQSAVVPAQSEFLTVADAKDVEIIVSRPR